MSQPDQAPAPFDLVRLPGADHEPRLALGLLQRRRLPASLGTHANAAGAYRPSPDLLTAINMAIQVGAPLLLTGEPGTGKTVAGDFIGAFFGIAVYKFQVKFTSTADDLKYDFDAVGYLHWAQSAKGADGAGRGRRDFLQRRALWEAYDCPTESVVLIDEIDKAPRDFPNDLLHELDQHRFQHPFDDTEIVSPKSGRSPILVVTSNDERRLPDAFLRRCIFHRIELRPELVAAAVEAHLGDFPRLDRDTRAAAQRRCWDLRESRLDKPLGARPGIGTLVKDPEDQKVLTHNGRRVRCADRTPCTAPSPIGKQQQPPVRTDAAHQGRRPPVRSQAQPPFDSGYEAPAS